MKTSDPKQRRLAKLLRVLQEANRILILTHDNPDPDCLASGLVLKRVLTARLKAKVYIGYGGIIGRAENRAMMDTLRIEAMPLRLLDIDLFDAVVLVDTQPRTGNNSLPPRQRPTVVIDHHPLRPATKRVPCYDVRPEYGATVTITAEYLRAANLRADADLATAIVYALRAETQDLGREATEVDDETYFYYFSRADRRKVFTIHNANISREYFHLLSKAGTRTDIYGELAFCSFGSISNPDVVAEFADILVRLDVVTWSLVIGQYNDILVLSIRSDRPGARAGRIIRKIVGKEGSAGGHEMVAGGRIQVGEYSRIRYRLLERRILKRAKEALHISAPRENLC